MHRILSKTVKISLVTTIWGAVSEAIINKNSRRAIITLGWFGGIEKYLSGRICLGLKRKSLNLHTGHLLPGLINVKYK